MVTVHEKVHIGYQILLIFTQTTLYFVTFVLRCLIFIHTCLARIKHATFGLLVLWFKCVIFKKYKTFSVLIYSYINTSGNWKNEKLCGNTTPAGRSVFTQFRVFPIFTSVDITVYQYGKNVLYFFYNIAQRTLTEEWREIFCVDIELYQHGS